MRLHPGEFEASGWRVEKLSHVVRGLQAASPAVTGRPRIIAIDGRGGAGKTTIVAKLQEVVPSSAVVHTDHVAWNHSFFGWGSLLVEQILRPLHQGEAVAVDLRPADCPDDRPGVITIPAGLDVVWVEGTGIIRRELEEWIDASIWMQGDLDEQERRLVARDGDSASHQRHVADWLKEELPLMLREVPWERATVVIAGTTELDHDPGTEVAVAPPVRSPAADRPSAKEDAVGPRLER